MNDLVATARSLFAEGKGILAADESVASATKRLAAYGVGAGEEMRRQYRDLFLGAEGVEQYLSGVILFSETLLEKGNDKKRISEKTASKELRERLELFLFHIFLFHLKKIFYKLFF